MAIVSIWPDRVRILSHPNRSDHDRFRLLLAEGSDKQTAEIISHLTEELAIELRDLLIELLPVERQQELEPADHRVTAGFDACGASGSEWVECFKIEYLLTERARDLQENHPGVAQKLKLIHEAVYELMMKAVVDIGDVCTGGLNSPCEEVPVEEAEDSAREVDAMAVRTWGDEFDSMQVHLHAGLELLGKTMGGGSDG